MPVARADVLRRPRAFSVSVRDRPVQRRKNRVRCGCGQRQAHEARRDHHRVWDAWRRQCPLGGRRRSRDPLVLHCTLIDRPRRVETRSRARRRCRVRTRTNTAIFPPPCPPAHRDGASCEGLVTDRESRRRSPSLRDAGVSRCPDDVSVFGSRVAARRDACARRSAGTRHDVLTHRRHSASRDPRGRLARVRIHPVRPGRVPSGTRHGPGGAPA
jgi:hypothetical protein